MSSVCGAMKALMRTELSSTTLGILAACLADNVGYFAYELVLRALGAMFPWRDPTQNLIEPALRFSRTNQGHRLEKDAFLYFDSLKM